MNVLITIPHHSTKIPKGLHHWFNISASHMNRHLDFGTERLFDLDSFSVIKLDVSRFVVDVNRARDDLREGQGVIITETWNGEKVLKHELTEEHIEERLKKYYDPFYKNLNSELERVEKPLLVIDGHSMDSKGSLVAGDSGNSRPQIDLATGEGNVSEEILKVFEDEFKEAGYSVERNNPYSGANGNIMRHCTSVEGVQALVVEVNKSIYMNEQTFELDEKGIERFRLVMDKILNKLKGL